MSKRRPHKLARSKKSDEVNDYSTASGDSACDAPELRIFLQPLQSSSACSISTAAGNEVQLDKALSAKLQKKEKDPPYPRVRLDDNISTCSQRDSYLNVAYEKLPRCNARLRLSSDQQRLKSSNTAAFMATQGVKWPYKNPKHLLVASLFPKMPPYITFSSALAPGPEVDATIRKLLVWQLTNLTPYLVRDTLLNTGFTLALRCKKWLGVWGKRLKPQQYQELLPYQKCCHMAGSRVLSNKASCWQLLKQQQEMDECKHVVNCMPTTYCVPEELPELEANWCTYNPHNPKWILKPHKLARAHGIRIIHDLDDLPRDEQLVAQRYIDRPLLLYGYKFDLRLYAVITSVNPLRAYMHSDGLVRVATQRYSNKRSSLRNPYIHLTNYSVNKLFKSYLGSNMSAGNKWTLLAFLDYLREQHGVKTKDKVYADIQLKVARALLAAEQQLDLANKANFKSSYNGYELLGVDILIDEQLRTWLLEFNVSPSLHCDTVVDVQVKAPLVQAVLNVALYNLPPILSENTEFRLALRLGYDARQNMCFDERLYSRELTCLARCKQEYYEQKIFEREVYLRELLAYLTPEDVRCLVITEDELARSGPLERIFPRADTYKLWIKSSQQHPGYYNMLLDAWEHEYSGKREVGLKLLRRLCEDGWHLKVGGSWEELEDYSDDYQMQRLRWMAERQDISEP